MSLVGSPVMAHAGNTGTWTVDMDGETIRGMEAQPSAASHRLRMAARSEEAERASLGPVSVGSAGTAFQRTWPSPQVITSYNHRVGSVSSTRPTLLCASSPA